MKRKVLVVVLSLALLVGGVALGIHVLHKDALALTYKVYIWQDGGQEAGEFPLEDAQVEMAWKVNGEWSDWQLTTDEGEGTYTCTHGSCERWKVLVTSPVDFDGENPLGNPCSPQTAPPYFFEWQGWWAI